MLRAARMALLGGLMVVCVGSSTALAAAPPPCSPSVAARPVITATDPEDNIRDTRLTATHDIVLRLEFALDGPEGENPSWSGPSGVPMITHRSRGAREIDVESPYDVAFRPPAAGPLPVTVSWQQRDGTPTGRCSASGTTTLQIEAARRGRVGRPAGNLSRRSEHQWTLGFGLGTDLRPVDVRLRSVRTAQFPGRRVPFRTVRRILRPTDTGTFRDQSLFAPFTRVRIESVGDPRGLIVTFNVRGVITNPRLGYELDVRQAGRRLFRVRGAGRCSAFGCVFSRLNLQRP